MGETPCEDPLSFPSFCPVVAPYAADIDLDIGGTVRYTDFDAYSSSGSSMTRVSRFIQDETGDSFYGTRMMVAEWNGVSKYSVSLIRHTNEWAYIYWVLYPYSQIQAPSKAF